MRGVFHFQRSNLSWRTLSTHFKKKDIGLLGAPVEEGQSRQGVSCAPQLLRKSKIINEIEKFVSNVHDFGDLKVVKYLNEETIFNCKYPRAFNANTIKGAEKIKEILNKDYIPLTIGGDHSFSTGSILGNAQVNGNICVIWVDAHADINTPLSSTSGYMHGMPLSFLVHEMQNEMPWIEEFKDIIPVISAKDLAYIGLRDIDPYEKYVIDKYKIKAFTMEEVDKLGINCVIQEAIYSVNPNLDKAIHLSFDIDSLDPIYAPCTGTKVPGGLTLREGIYLCEQLYNTGKLSAIDIAEINTQLGSNFDALTTLDSAIKVILACLGIRRSGLPIINPEYYSWQDMNPSRNDIFKKQ